MLKVLGAIACGGLLLSWSRCGAATSTVLNISSSGPNVGAINDKYLGVGITTGASQTLFTAFTAPIQYGTFGPPYDPILPTLEIEARGTNGSVGSTLYTTSSKNWSYNGVTFTFSGDNGFTFQPESNYWFVFSEPGWSGQAGFAWFGRYGGVPNHVGLDGFSIPETNYAFASQIDNSAGDGYLDQLQTPFEPAFSLGVTSIPEPNLLVSCVLAGFVVRRSRSNPTKDHVASSVFQLFS